MVEKYLGQEQADEIFSAGFMDAMSDAVSEKRASWAKVLAFLKGAGKATVGVGGHAVDAAHKIISTVPGLAVAGLSTGALGAIGYNAIKDNLMENSPKEELDAKIDAMYSNRTKELESAKWMDRVRAMRDELKRGYKKMSVEEYTQKYQALVDALDERKA